MDLITCSASYGTGGLGNLLADVVEAARATGRPFHYLAGELKPNDDAIGQVVRSRVAPLLSRVPPMRFDPGWRQLLTFDLFDRASARRVTPGTRRVLAFAGQALRTFRAARRCGCEWFALVSPTAHIGHVRRQYNRANSQYPIERDWLSQPHHDKVLAEYEVADVILVVSEYARQTFIEAGIAARKLYQFPVSVASRYTTADRSPGSTFRVVYTGALSVVKGVPLLIDAFERLSVRDAELTLVGGSGTRGMKRYLERVCRRDPRIHVAPGDPLPHLRRADVYVHPSYQDGFAYAVAEALACGVPVIVTQDTGAKERVVEGVNGWVVPTGDVDAIHARLAQLATSVRSKASACAS